jgi:Secretion system C-terminal sorting domain
MKKLLLILLLLPVFAEGQIITTIAGGGTSLADGVPATSANLGVFPAVAFDTSGNLILGENNNQFVRRVNLITGIITTIAGTGVLGVSADGGQATAAKLTYPNHVAVDRYNNVYISDHPSRIRKVNAVTGIITTIAGNGILGFSGDGGPATNASFNDVEGIEFDSIGNLYISDWYNFRIRKVDTAGIITTFAGTGVGGFGGDGGPATAAQFQSSWCLRFDNFGDLYLADYPNHRVRKINMATGIITTVVGNGLPGFSGDGGPATAANAEPWYINFDASNNMYISDSNRVRIVYDSSEIINTIAGNSIQGFLGDGGPATAAEFSQNAELAIDPKCENLFIADCQNKRVRKITLNLSCNPTLNIINALKANEVSIYPNPTTTSLTIQSTDQPINQIAITNLLGQTVYTHEYNTEKAELNVSTLPTGIYFIKINNTEVRKFVKQ